MTDGGGPHLPLISGLQLTHDITRTRDPGIRDRTLHYDMTLLNFCLRSRPIDPDVVCLSVVMFKIVTK